VWSAPARPGPPGLLTAATAGPTTMSSRTHAAIVPALTGRVTR
jgi:hypothetical protein